MTSTGERALLTEIANHGEPRISVAELMHKFGGRAFGALLFVFGLACLLPWPPGGTTIFGFPLVLLSPLWLLFIFPGAIAYAVVWLWYLYRCLKGWLRFNANRPPQSHSQNLEPA